MITLQERQTALVEQHRALDAQIEAQQKVIEGARKKIQQLTARQHEIRGALVVVGDLIQAENNEDIASEPSATKERAKKTRSTRNQEKD